MTEPSTATIVAARVQVLLDEQINANYSRTSRMFAVLMGVEWLFGILVALVWSPYTWAGKVHAVHLHVYVAIFLGGAIVSLPIAAAMSRPRVAATRYVVAIGQMLWSALLIHLTGGRIETHFHVFGSLAFLAFYRDWKVLVPATVVVAADHLLRGIFWPESVYGMLNPEWWRFLEHAFWVAFEDVILVLSCLRGSGGGAEPRRAPRRGGVPLSPGEAEGRCAGEEPGRARELTGCSDPRGEARGRRPARRERRSRAAKPPGGRPQRAHLHRPAHRQGRVAARDRRARQAVLGDRRTRANACSKIIDDLLDFARAKAPTLRPCPLRPLVDEAISLLASNADGERSSTRFPTTCPFPTSTRTSFVRSSST